MFWKTSEQTPELTEIQKKEDDELNSLLQEITSPREKAATRVATLPSSKFPSELSCLTALDELMQCMSLGGQIRNYYRYGDLTFCDRQNDKLNFCFSQSIKSAEEKAENVREWYRKDLENRLKAGSSEDVWESR